jgi:hypothetical protein
VRSTLVAAAAAVALAAWPCAGARAEAGSLEAEVTRFLEAWRDAWVSLDLPAYLALHARDLVSGDRDRQAFVAHKARVFARRERVEVHLGNLDVAEVTVAAERLVRARFLQDYRSPSLSDVGRKELLLRRVPGGRGFEIVRETWQASAERIARSLGRAAPAVSPAAGARPAAEDWGWQPRVGAYEPPVEEPLLPEQPVDDLLRFEPRLDELPSLPPPIAGLPGDVGGRRVIEEIVARINGRVLTRSMFLERLQAYQDQLLRDDPPDLEERLQVIVKETLETTIDRWLILEEARERQADIEAFWREWLSQKRREIGAKDVAELERMFGEQGLSLEQLKALVIEQDVPNYYIKSEVSDRIDVSEPALAAYHEQHADRYRRERALALRQILVPVPAGGDPARAMAVAEQVLAELRAGGDWCDLHARYGVAGSPCGEVGEVALGDLIPELRPVAEGLPLGATSKPVRSPAGVHLVQVTARSGGEALALDEVRQRVRDDMFQEAFDERLEKLLQDLRARAQLEINPRYDAAASPEAVGAAGPAAASRSGDAEKVVAR